MHAALNIITIAFLLCVLAGLLMVVISILFQFRWLVPFVPTPMPIVETMLDLAELKPGDRVLDLGAGDARFLFLAKKREPGILAVGYEGAVGVWLLGKFRIWWSGQKGIDLECRNFFKEDFSNADVIFTYLSMHVMRMLIPKFEKELKPGTRIVSHAFQLPARTAVRMKEVPMHFGGRTKAYCYVW